MEIHFLFSQDPLNLLKSKIATMKTNSFLSAMCAHRANHSQNEAVRFISKINNVLGKNVKQLFSILYYLNL